MKQFYMKEKIFSFRDSYKIYNADDNVAYYAKARFSFKGSVDFYNGETEEKIFTLKKKIFSIMPKYYLFDSSNQLIATIKKHFAFFKHNVTIESSMGNLDLTGNYMAYDFFITKDDKEIVDVHKKIFSFGDAYEILIDEDEHEAFLLAMVLMIDRMFHNNKHRSSRSNNR
jgi:uncharacterized protein YxjI